MSTPETEEAPQPRKRPGRKPGKRRDPVPAPVDGDYQLLDIVNKQPGFEYFALSDFDRRKRGQMHDRMKTTRELVVR